jgi:hypothetical protein
MRNEEIMQYPSSTSSLRSSIGRNRQSQRSNGIFDDSDGKNNNNNNNQWWIGQYDTTNLSHPHLGARHPDDGSIGWIVNPSVDRLRPADQQRFVEENTKVCPPTTHVHYGIEGEGGNKVLHKIQRGLDKSRHELLSTSSSSTSSSIAAAAAAATTQQPRILCMIYTCSRNDTGHINLAAIAYTWGRRCDGFIGFSNVTDHSVGAIDFNHQGPPTYTNSTFQKLMHIF